MSRVVRAVDACTAFQGVYRGMRMAAPSVRIPHLELVEELGRGAHSVVLRGVRAGCSYAVKLPLGADSESARRTQARRFRREAIALARVRHPALPEVMEVGHADGVPYLVMELIGGRTLAEHIAERTLGEVELVDLGRQLASALAAIHRAGILHRDIKPHNILLGETAAAARLVDFGFAAPSDVSRTGAGTWAYAAPEVLSPDKHRVDGRADLFSLGCVLYECASGVSPFAAVPRRGELSSRPAPDPLGSIAPVSGELSAIIGRLLEEDPDKRFLDAAALLEALGALGRPLPFAESPPPEALRLIGRRAELDRLRRAWADTSSGGRVFVVTGGPGSGKTRLVEAFLAEASAAGALVLRAAAHQRDPGAFSVVRQLLDGFVRIASRETPERRDRLLGALREAAGNLGSLVKLLSPALARVFHDAPSVPEAGNAEQVYVAGLADLLVKLLARVGPVIVLVDDVQWLDSSSHKTLRRAADQAAASRTLYIFLARDDPASQARLSDFLDVVRAARIVELRLRPLREEESIQLVRAFLAAVELDRNVIDAVLRLTDGTPLAVLEVLRVMLEEGVLRPHWGRWLLDRNALAELQLSGEMTKVLRRRIEALEPSARGVLAAAAVAGSAFEHGLLAKVCDSDDGAIPDALREAGQAQLVEEAGPWMHRFVHESVREALLASLGDDERRELHQRIAEALDEELFQARDVLDEQAAGDPETIYRIAAHYAEGVSSRAQDRAYAVAVSAGRVAYRRFDNERALGFFSAANRAAGRCGSVLGPEDRFLIGEASLRTGALQEALVEFRNVLNAADNPLLQASALSQIAWIYDMQLDSTRAWAALEQAFEKLGEAMPHESSRSAATSLRSFARRQLGRAGPPIRDPLERRRAELLCTLCYQTGRLGHRTAKPMRTILSGVRAIGVGERLGPSSALVRSYLHYSFVLTALGMRSAGRRYLERADDIAKKLRDPVAYSHASQVRTAIAAWAGRMEESLDAGARCILEYGHWRELSEFCLTVYSQQQIEAVRGRCRESWRWMDVAVQRVNQHEGAPVVLEFVELGAHAALTALGRQDEAPILLKHLREATISVPRDSGFYPSTYGPRIRSYTECLNFGPGFESLVAEFRALGLNPKRVYLDVVEFYIHLAHARVHACLRASPEQKAACIEKLRDALNDLRQASRIPLLLAHTRAIEGYYEWLLGRQESAEARFADAERLAEQENAPWVVYAVHRGRAHMLRATGRQDAARDQAIAAEAVAREHGAVYRARAILEEFDLHPRRQEDRRFATPLSPYGTPSQLSAFTSVVSGARARRQLRALLRISQAAAQELDAEHQAQLVVDELLQGFHADRGFLFLVSDLWRADNKESTVGRLELVSGRDIHGRDLTDIEDYDRSTVHDAFVYGAADTQDGLHCALTTRSSIGTTARVSTAAAPLIVGNTVAGVVYLDRPLSEGAFTDVDGEILAALATQVSVVLELSQSLAVRERAAESLRNTEKMEAIGRLAGTIAHDLNNMLTAIRYATSGIEPEPSPEIAEDLQTIHSAVDRANELVRQLGDFSRGEFATREPVQLNERVRRFAPTLRGLLGESIRLELELDPMLAIVLADPDEIDSILQNLSVNARDALSNRGTLRIETANVVLDDAYAREHPRVKKGPYVRLTVQDTGHGIEAAIIERIFEPFFTTKGDKGSGVGLASVYGFVKKLGGHIDVESEVARGSTFSVYLPQPPGSKTSLLPADLPHGSETILLVEDDPLTAQQLERVLVQLGYAVFHALSSRQALEVVTSRQGEVDLVITEVVLPGMNGLELARELRKFAHSPRVLHLAVDTGGVLAERGIAGEQVEFLQKPVSTDVLARRVRDVLTRKPSDSGVS